jgi:hypothetical protein
MPTTTPVIRTTFLQAVNVCLKAIGVSEVHSLATEDANSDSEGAIAVLGEVAIEVLSRGWHFNTEIDYPIEPNGDGEAELPSNVLKVKTAYTSDCDDFTERGGRLYNRIDHTFTVTETVYVEMVLALPFEEMPQAFRWYITMRAARRYATQKTVSDDVRRFTQGDEEEARNLAIEADAEVDDRTMSGASPHVARMRRGQRRAG